MEDNFRKHWHNTDPKCPLPAGLTILHTISSWIQKELFKSGPCTERLGIPSVPACRESCSCSRPSQGTHQQEPDNAGSTSIRGLRSARGRKSMWYIPILLCTKNIFLLKALGLHFLAYIPTPEASPNGQAQSRTEEKCQMVLTWLFNSWFLLIIQTKKSLLFKN